MRKPANGPVTFEFPGTFVYRPCFADRKLFGPHCHFTGTLWHPVKE
jgi:hypothetical protein